MSRHIRILASKSNNSEPSSAAPAPEGVALESDFVVILAALLCALICMVGLIAVARCAWLRRGSGPGPNNSNHSSSANKGLKKKTLQSLPKFTYTQSQSQSQSNSGECAICLGEFLEGDEIRMLPQCGHCFHMGCVDTWLGSHSSCPSCRQILVVTTTTRCHNCGHLPAAAVNEQELKAREDHNPVSNNNNNNNSRGFLP